MEDYYDSTQVKHSEVQHRFKFTMSISMPIYCTQKYSRLRQPLQKISSLFKAEPDYEGRLKVILLIQTSSHDFEPTFITFCLN